MDAPKVCEHLQAVVDYLAGRGEKVTFAGQAWSSNCRLWVYFDCELDVEALRERFALPSCITVHVNEDPRSGRERGLVCELHCDGVIGLYPATR